jgi:C1A family cysteine protease
VTRVYGWKPDLPDKRDQYVQLAGAPGEAFPAVHSFRKLMPPVWNQMALGACTAFSSLGAFVYERQLQLPDTTEPWFWPSFLQVYYSTRAVENSVAIDAGAYIRDTCKVLAQCGVAPAQLWPYVESKFAQKPPKRALLAALDNRVTSYMRVQRNITGIRRVLLGGNAIVFGISVYSSFESDKVARTGMVPMPSDDEELLGGHAVLMVGYDHDRKLIECRNSWGADWGDEGYFWLPYEYVTDPDLSDDFWTLKTVTEAV